MAEQPGDIDPPGGISIIVRTMGQRLRLLARALASIRNQTVRPSEVIVVEDGSSRAAPVVADANATGVEIFRHLPITSSGRSLAGNYGLEASKGALLGLLDEDDEYYPNHLARLSAALADEPSAVLAYARADVVFCEGLGADEEREPETRPPPRYAPFSRTRLWFENQFPIQSAIFRRSLFERCGGFDPTIAYLEDWDLWIRYSAASDFVAVADVTSLYRLPKEPGVLEARASLHAPWRTAVQAKHRNLLALHRFEEVVNPTRPPPQSPTFRQALGVGRRAFAMKLTKRRSDEQ